MSYYSLSYVCEKLGVGEEVDKTIYALPKIVQVQLLTIYGVLFLKDMERLANKFICLYFIVCVLLKIYH